MKATVFGVFEDLNFKISEGQDQAKLRQPTGQRLSNVRTQQTKISIGPILFLYKRKVWYHKI